MDSPYLSRKALLLYISIWIVITVAHTIVLLMVMQQSFRFSFVDALIYNTLYGILGISLWYPTKFISVENYHPVRIVGNHFAGAVISSLVWISLGYLILSSIFPSETEFLNSTLIWRFIIGLFFYIVIISTNYLIIYYNNFHEKLLKEAELKTLVKEAELKSLKYQINPHFIFNSLNSIAALTYLDAEKAREMTIKLSSFFRSTISKSINQLSKLSEELSNIRLYLEIEKVRFAGKFDFIEEVSDKCKDVLIPNMILQPLAENAIKYGVYEATEPVIIKLECIEQGGFIRIIMSNDFDENTVPKKGEGIGLQNIKNRLDLLYGEESLIKIKKQFNKFIVELIIPKN